MKFWKIAFLFAASAFSSIASASMDEFTNCAVPQEILFKREYLPYFYTSVNKRYERHAGGTLMLMDNKNPENVHQHGPAHFQNCTDAQNLMMTHRVRFLLKTTNFFGYNGLANHIAIALRGSFSRYFMTPGGDEVGRGIAAFTWNPVMKYSGTKFEKFVQNNQSITWPNEEHSFNFSDNQWYQVELRASTNWVRLIVLDQYGTLLLDRAEPVPDGNDPTGTGFGVGILCKEYTNCEYPYIHPYFTEPYEVHMNNIQMDWKYDSQFGY